MANKIKRFFAVVLAVTAAAMLLSSCSLFSSAPKLTDEDAVSVLSELIPTSQELNEIFLGEGLRAEGDESGSNYDFGAEYYPVASDEKYQSIDEIKSAAEKVFSADYLKTLYRLAFDGVEETVTSAPETEEGETAKVDLDAPINEAIEPRYIMKEDRLCVDVKYKGYKLTSEPIASSARVTKQKFETATVELDYKDGDGNLSQMKIELVYENDGWRLDSPTY